MNYHTENLRYCIHHQFILLYKTLLIIFK